jgi:hypothetical protein
MEDDRPGVCFAAFPSARVIRRVCRCQATDKLWFNSHRDSKILHQGRTTHESTVLIQLFRSKTRNIASPTN